MPYQLLDLEVEEVSGVDLAANMRKFLVIKQADVSHSAEPPPPTEGDPMAETLEGVTKRAEAAEARVKELEVIAKRAETAEAELKKALATVEDLSGKVTELEKTVATTETALAKARQTPEEQEAEYEASLPEHVRKRREAEKLELAEVRKKLQEADERAERTEYIQKTAAYRPLGLTPDHWEVLKAIDAMPEEPRGELLRLLMAQVEQAKTSTLFKSVGFGESNGHAGENASAEAQLMSLTDAYQAEHKCDMSTAQNAIMKQHPDVYNRYVIEKRQKTRVASE